MFVVNNQTTNTKVWGKSSIKKQLWALKMKNRKQLLFTPCCRSDASHGAWEWNSLSLWLLSLSVAPCSRRAPPSWWTSPWWERPTAWSPTCWLTPRCRPTPAPPCEPSASCWPPSSPSSRCIGLAQRRCSTPAMPTPSPTPRRDPTRGRRPPFTRWGSAFTTTCC